MDNDKWVADPGVLRVKTTPMPIIPKPQKPDQVVKLDEDHSIRDVPDGTR